MLHSVRRPGASAPGRGRGQHADGLRAVRGRAARRTAGASRPSRGGRATSSASCSAMLDLDASTASASPRPCRRSSRRTRASRSAGPRRRSSSSAAGGEQRDPDPLRRPAPGRPRPDRERRRRLVAVRRAVHRRRLRHLDELRRGRRRRRVRGAVLAPGVEISMDALFQRRAADQGRLRGAALGDREDDDGGAPVGPRLRLRRPGRRDRRRHPRRARGRGAGDRDRRARRVDRAAARSTR